MAKIFDLDFRKGTLIDSVNKTAGTLTAGTGGFKKTEKGLAMEFDGSATNIALTSRTYNVGSEEHTFEFYIKKTSDKYQNLLGKSTDNNTSNIRVDIINRFEIRTDTNTYIIGASDLNTQFNHLLFVFKNNIIYTYLNNSLKYTTTISSSDKLTINRIGSASSNFWKGYIGIIRIFDTALTTQERNELYKEFLNSSPTEKEIRGFEYPKPTDSSHEEGLVAHYVFSKDTVVNE